MFPLRDDNPSLGRPVVTWMLVTANVVAWFLVQGAGGEPFLSHSVCTWGLIPGELLQTVADGTRVRLGEHAACVLQHGADGWWSPLTSMFLHGGWMHLVGNLWFLWVFGDNVEDVMGPLRFLVFYLACGLAAAAAQVLSAPDSTVPMIGASGAIGGVMGAYASLYPRARVQMLVVLGFYLGRVAMPAVVVLGYWFLLQVLGSLPEVDSSAGGVAFWAHIGGFAAGFLFSYLFRDPVRVEAHRQYVQGHFA